MSGVFFQEPSLSLARWRRWLIAEREALSSLPTYSADDPFRTRALSAAMSEAPYGLDGLHLHAHQIDLRVAEHYTTRPRDPIMWFE